MNDERKYSILLVDDDTLQLGWISRGLIRAGYEVTTAHDGIDALAQAFERPPDVIVTDVYMSPMHGLDLCKRVREDARLSRLPVVLMSGNRFSQQDRAYAMHMGATVVVSLEPDRSLKDLLAALHSLLGPEAA